MVQENDNVYGQTPKENLKTNYVHSNPLRAQGSTDSSYWNLQRPDILFSDVADDLNTYRNWAEFHLYLPTHPEQRDKDGKPTGKPIKAAGVKAIFNNVNAVPEYGPVRMANNIPLLDNPSIREKLRAKSDCTVRELVRASSDPNGNMGRAIYSYADFMYCKHLGEVTNNHLITLRRFPYPAGDHINYTIHEEKDSQQHMPDIGRMVTWLGVSDNNMSNILKYSVKMPFKEMTAELQKKNETADHGAAGILGTILNASSAKNQQMMREGVVGTNALHAIGTMLGGTKAGGIFSSLTSDPPYSMEDFNLDEKKNKLYGPIDVVKKVWMRDDENGLIFDHKMTLNFEYEMRSYDGINSKAAMLDLIANVLTTTYTSGKFWGGGVQYFGTHQSNLFANLPIYKRGLTFQNLSDRLWQSYTAISQQFGSEGVLDTLKKVASSVVDGFGSALLGGMLNKLGRPQRMGLEAFLSGAPVGLWHVMIGNPKNPILSMGNMIVTNTTIEHTGPLGIDDFPTGLKVTVELTHGKGRDINLIEQMYLMGDHRIYSPMGSKVEEMYKDAKDYKVEKKQIEVQAADETDNATTEAAEPVTLEITTNDGFQKFFGTNDPQAIAAASTESHFGSAKEVKQGDGGAAAGNNGSGSGDDWGKNDSWGKNDEWGSDLSTDPGESPEEKKSVGQKVKGFFGGLFS